MEEYTKKANEDERIDLKDVEVSAYASPDGDIDFNTELAAKRKNTSSDFCGRSTEKRQVLVLT